MPTTSRYDFFPLADVYWGVEELARLLRLGVPVSDWPGWAVYLVEVLEQRLYRAGDDPEQFLEQVRAAISSRLDRGQW